MINLVKPILVANSLSLTVLLLRLIIVIKAFLMPDLFAWMHKAMMMGANSSFSNPTGQEAFIVVVIPTAMAWVVGFVWANIYNKLAKG